MIPTYTLGLDKNQYKTS